MAQFSDDLVNWYPADPTPVSNSVYDVILNDGATYTVRDKAAISSKNARFARIVIKQAE